jgi:hypothetical protein
MSVLTLAYQSYSPDSVSFYRKTATYEGQGMLIFLIDGQEKNRWSGDLDWKKVSYPLSAGKHTFIWMFLKFGDSDLMDDRVWVDLISLPQLESTTVWAGFDASVCLGEIVQLNGTATNYDSINWSTAGTGAFDDVQRLDAQYTPSEEDFSLGEFTLTLTAWDADENMLFDYFTGTVLPTPMIASYSLTADTVYTVATPITEITGESADYATDYLWTLSPELAGDITFSGQQATVNWNLLFSGEATIGYQGLNNCGPGEITKKTVIVSNATSVNEIELTGVVTVFPNPNKGSFTIRMDFQESRNIKLKLVDITGREVWTKNLKNTLKTEMVCRPEQLQQGVYQLIILSNDFKTVRKIVVQ